MEGRRQSGLPTSQERWRLVSSLLDVLLDLPVEARPARLTELCPGDPSLRAEVEALLDASVRAEGFLEQPALRDASLWEADSHVEPISHAGLMPGSVAGTYRILHELGRGGMGVVFLAEPSDNPQGTRVALKILRRGLDTSSFRRRFLRERAILGVLQHPNIAALIDGGATDDGLPYIVMEYVEGSAITRWCDDHASSIETRLDLFRTACEAVGYAHARDVVHRDLKPANIFVTAEGTVKLLDFGIARLVAGVQPGPSSSHTRAGERIITPEYASPEQIRGEAPTTSMDVYALGVVLYELLVGRRPYALPPGGAETLERYVSAASPAAPSRALMRSTSERDESKAQREEIARTRSTTTSELRRILRDGLDSIVLRALSPRPERRYVSVSELLQDLAWWREH